MANNRNRTIKDIVSNKYETPVCFYTGLTCNRIADNPMSATLEHIVPFGLVEDDSDFLVNEVPAIGFVNVLVGRAPITVKYAVKEACSNVIVPNVYGQEQLIKTYTNIIRSVLNAYKPQPTALFYPWQYLQQTYIIMRNNTPKKGFINRAPKLKELLLEILTDEEKHLYKNILDFDLQHHVNKKGA